MIRILCIEDDAETRILLKKILQSAGMTADTAWSGEKGVQAALDGSYDCILLDLLMPQIDGFQVLHMLRHQALTKKLPVVVITAMEDPLTKKKASALGADAFVSKPFNAEQLVQIIRNLTHSS